MSNPLDAILGPTGRVAASLGERFEPRPEQLTMARAVLDNMASRTKLLVEAGTGVGKSFAYLIPAALRIIEQGERVVIATNTIALQEQLLSKDVPIVSALFTQADAHHKHDAAGAHDYPEDPCAEDAHESWDDENPMPRPESDDAHAADPAFRVELVKGRGNYLSIRRLQLASKRADRLFADPAGRRSLHVIQEWAYETADGTLSTLPPLERPGTWDHARSDSGNCMGRKCPTYEQCFYQKARRRMERADLLICNHALFFSDLALRSRGVGFLPQYDHVILDEAHMVEDVASEHFGVSLAEGRVRHLLSTLASDRGTRRGGGSGSGAGKGALISIRLDDESLTARAIELVRRAAHACDQFFDQLVVHAASRNAGIAGNETGSGTVRLSEDFHIENPLTPAMSELVLVLKRMKERVVIEEDKFELASYIERAQAIAEEAEILAERQLDGCAYWAEVSRSTSSGVRARLACSPIEVAPLLRTHLFGDEFSVTLTSATLTTRGKSGGGDAIEEAGFAHIKKRIGCEDARTLALGSPFDHASLVQLFVEQDMPDPRDRKYEQALATRIHHHVQATDGGAFILFTSFGTMHRVADLCRYELESLGHPVLVHGKDGSRASMLETFRRDERSILFGTASFWQGVDVQGRGLRNVIITRLPFDPPDRPLTEARLELIQQRGGKPFFEDSLPRAVIRFKQGFGRLVRSATDTGRVVVLDPRIITKPYGKQFLNALPEGITITSSTTNASQDQTDF